MVLVDQTVVGVLGAVPSGRGVEGEESRSARHQWHIHHVYTANSFYAVIPRLLLRLHGITVMAIFVRPSPCQLVLLARDHRAVRARVVRGSACYAST